MRRLRLAFPAAAASFFGATFVRDTQIAGLLQSGDLQMAGWTRPQPSRSSRHDSPALRPAVARSSARYRMVRGDRLPSRVRPHRCGNQRHGARCLWRCISPPAAIRSAAWHVGRGVPRPGRVSPTDAWVAPRRVRLPGLRVSPANGHSAADYAELLRRAQNVLWTSRLAPARPSHETMGRHLSGAHSIASSAHHQRRVFSSPCRQRVRGAFSAPSLPESRHGHPAPLQVETMCDEPTR